VRYRCIITSPLGVELDVSELLEIGAMGTISWAPESDLTVMAHGDFSLALDNSDGRVEELLGPAQPGDLYEMILSREGSVGWDRVFGGILDLPYSLVYDDKDKLATIECYSFSKLLERTSAEPIKRTLASKTASITEATRTLVFLTGETADLLPGDIVKLDSGTGRTEEMVIDKITSSSQAIVTKDAGSTFSSALVTVETPYYHDKTPAYLLDLVADECGLELDASDLSLDVATFPIATPMTLEGLNITEIPVSLVPTGTTVLATFGAADETNRKSSAAPTTAWTDGAASNTPQGDWTPYLLSEPASIMASALGGAYDNGASAWDHTNSHVFYVVQVATGSPSFLQRLHLYRDSTDLGFWHSVVDGESYNTARCEYDPVNDRVWVSSYGTDGTRKFSWIPAAGGAFTSYDATRSGEMRLCRLHNVLILVDDVTEAMRFYDLTSLTLIREITFPYGLPVAWSIRAWDEWFVFLVDEDGRSRVVIYETSGWTFVSAYLLSPNKTYRRFLTIQTLTDGRQVGIIFAGMEWFVFSLRYDGVVRYADFDGASCGQAANDLAIVTNSIVNVDNFKVFSLKNRLALGRNDAVDNIGTAITSKRRPVSEMYRASVSVTGQSPSNEDIKVIVGDTGDSARRLEISSNFATTYGIAVATAIATQQFVERIQGQWDVTADDDGPVLKFGDRVTMGDRSLFVYKAEVDLEQQQQHLTLLEVVE